MIAPNFIESTTQLDSSSAARRAGSAFRVEVFSSFEAARCIRELWTNLLKEVEGDLFGSFQWCATWWRHFSKRRRLEIYAFWSGEQLVALFPCFRETLRCGPFKLRVVRFLGSDHAGTRCWPIFKNWAINDVASLFLESLSRSQSWDIVNIGDLPGYFHQIDDLVAALQNASTGRISVNRNYYPHAVFPLGSNFDEFLLRLSANERNNIRKNERKLSKEYMLQSSLAQCSQAFLEDYFAWHDQYWKSQNQLGFYNLWPGSREFHDEFVTGEQSSPQPVLFQVHADNHPVGLVCAHRFNDKLHLFQAVRAPGDQWESFGPGRLLHCELFRWCMNQGIKMVDAMSGFYEYKRRLGAEFLSLTTIAVVNGSRPSQKRVRHFRRLVGLVNDTYFRLWLCKMAPVLRKRFPMFDFKFLRSGMRPWFIRSRFLLAAFPARSTSPDEVVQDVQNI